MQWTVAPFREYYCLMPRVPEIVSGSGSSHQPMTKPQIPQTVIHPHLSKGDTSPNSLRVQGFSQKRGLLGERQLTHLPLSLPGGGSSMAQRPMRHVEPKCEIKWLDVRVVYLAIKFFLLILRHQNLLACYGNPKDMKYKFPAWNKVRRCFLPAEKSFSGGNSLC